MVYGYTDPHTLVLPPGDGLKVYLDDCRCPPDGWLLVRYVVEVKLLLRLGLVDYLSLDNDLGFGCERCYDETTEHGRLISGWQCAGTRDKCFCECHVEGHEVVRWMIETGHWPKHKPYVHSANGYWRPKMFDDIEKHWPGEKK